MDERLAPINGLPYANNIIDASLFKTPITINLKLAIRCSNLTKTNVLFDQLAFQSAQNWGEKYDRVPIIAPKTITANKLLKLTSVIYEQKSIV